MERVRRSLSESHTLEFGLAVSRHVLRAYNLASYCSPRVHPEALHSKPQTDSKTWMPASDCGSSAPLWIFAYPNGRNHNSISGRCRIDCETIKTLHIFRGKNVSPMLFGSKGKNLSKPSKPVPRIPEKFINATQRSFAPLPHAPDPRSKRGSG